MSSCFSADVRCNGKLTRIDLGSVIVWVSYQTVIAFCVRGKLVISENVWSNTTGRHLNYINADHSIRIDHKEFVREWETLQEVLEDSIDREIDRMVSPVGMTIDTIWRYSDFEDECTPKQWGKIVPRISHHLNLENSHDQIVTLIRIELANMQDSLPTSING